MPEFARRPEEPAAKPKEDELASATEQAPPVTAGQTRTSTPNLRLRYRPAGVATPAATETAGQGAEPQAPELPEHGELMAVAPLLSPDLPDKAKDALPGLPKLPAQFKVDAVWAPAWWQGWQAGLNDGFTQNLQGMVGLAQHAPEILARMPELIGAAREALLHLNSSDIDLLINQLGEAKEAHFKAKPYQQGHDIGEIVAGLVLAKGGEKLLAIVGKATGLTALTAEMGAGLRQGLRDGLRGRGPQPLGAGVDGQTVPLDPTTIEPPGSSGAFNKKLSPRDGFFKPNEDYRVGPHTYYTDGLGRVRRVSGELRLPPKARDRNAYQQTKKAGKEGGPAAAGQDDGGHLIASMFDGAGERINMKAMRRDLNQNGDWRDLEREWEAALKAGGGVRVDIRVVYAPGSQGLRAEAFDIDYWLNGEHLHKFLDNTAVPGGTP